MSTGKVVDTIVAAPSKKSSPLRTSGVGVGDPSHHHPAEKKNNDAQEQQRERETNPIDFIEQSFFSACAAAAPAEMKYGPTREEIGRALKRSEGDIPGAIGILRQQWTIKIESKELGKAMEESLRENEENEKKRKREEEEEEARSGGGVREWFSDERESFEEDVFRRERRERVQSDGIVRVREESEEVV